MSGKMRLNDVRLSTTAGSRVTGFRNEGDCGQDNVEDDGFVHVTLNTKKSAVGALVTPVGAPMPSTPRPKAVRDLSKDLGKDRKRVGRKEKRANKMEKVEVMRLTSMSPKMSPAR
ncbi:hypothetical protein J6590_052415 [Homalodisca vitripennis]|nr:hypothetical protein J6590_052415 [Homalodisca vitripennis]